MNELRGVAVACGLWSSGPRVPLPSGAINTPSGSVNLRNEMYFGARGAWFPTTKYHATLVAAMPIMAIAWIPHQLCCHSFSRERGRHPSHATSGASIFLATNFGVAFLGWLATKQPLNRENNTSIMGVSKFQKA